MSDDGSHNQIRGGVVIPFPGPFREPKTFDKKTSLQAREPSHKMAKPWTKRRRAAQKILIDHPAVMASAFDDFRHASVPVWRADIEAADDEEFVRAEIFLAQFQKITGFTHVSSYSLKHLCEDWHRCLGADDAYVANGVLIVAAISMGFRGKCVAGMSNAIFNLSRRDLKRLSRFVAEHRANTLAVNLRMPCR